MLSYTVNLLSPHTTYYFKVRAGHGCMPGSWSNILAAKTESKNILNSLKEQKTEKLISPSLTPYEKEKIKKTVSPTSVSFKKPELPEKNSLKAKQPPETNKKQPSFFQKIFDWFQRLIS